MKNKNVHFVFLIIPLVFFIYSSSLKEYQGPYYTNSLYDPSYVYLISSLNLAQMSGYGVGHIDHPGTPVQIIGAVILKLSFLFGGNDETMVNEVLMNPEKYMSLIEFVFLIINCIGLFILGLVSYKIYSRVSVSMLLQLTSFTSVTILALTTLLRPENFLIFVVCIFISALILFVNEKNLNAKKYFRYLILLGVISGLGIATKITFFPLLIVPLFLFREVKFKLFFIISVIISFIVFTIPAISSHNVFYFGEWVYNLFIHNKKYGKGESTIIDFNSYLYKIKMIINKEWIFDLAYFMNFLAILIYLISRSGNYMTQSANKFLKIAGNLVNHLNLKTIKESDFRLVTGLFLAMSLQILIVAKHFGDYYMFPALLLSVFSIFISISVFSESLQIKLLLKNMSTVYFSILILIFVYGTLSFYSYGNYLKNLTSESNKMIDFMKNYSGQNIVVSTHHVPGPEFALFTGTSYAMSQRVRYNSILYSKYPMDYFYQDNDCYSFNPDTSVIRDSFKSADKIILLCGGEDYAEGFKILLNKKFEYSNAVFEKIFRNGNGEMVYEINLNNH